VGSSGFGGRFSVSGAVQCWKYQHDADERFLDSDWDAAIHCYGDRPVEQCGDLVDQSAGRDHFQHWALYSAGHDRGEPDGDGDGGQPGECCAERVGHGNVIHVDADEFGVAEYDDL